jgi:hypothetical protein
MDFLIALKANESALVFLNLKKLLVLFAMMGNNEYVDYLLHHLLLFQYHIDIDHPHVTLFMTNLLSLVGEDIELGNRALSHCSVRNSRRSDPVLLDRSYRLLNYMYEAGVQFGTDLTEFKVMTKGTRRFQLNDGDLLLKARLFFSGVIDTFTAGSFQHYSIPNKIQQTSKRVTAKEMKENNVKELIILLSGDVESKAVAMTKTELRHVRYIASYNWWHFIDATMKSIFSKRRKWNVMSQLSKKTLRKLLRYDSQFIHPGFRESVNQYL